VTMRETLVNSGASIRKGSQEGQCCGTKYTPQNFHPSVHKRKKEDRTRSCRAVILQTERGGEHLRTVCQWKVIPLGSPGERCLWYRKKFAPTEGIKTKTEEEEGERGSRK